MSQHQFEMQAQLAAVQKALQEQQVRRFFCVLLVHFRGNVMSRRACVCTVAVWRGVKGVGGEGMCGVCMREANMVCLCGAWQGLWSFVRLRVRACLCLFISASVTVSVSASVSVSVLVSVSVCLCLCLVLCVPCDTHVCGAAVRHACVFWSVQLGGVGG